MARRTGFVLALLLGLALSAPARADDDASDPQGDGLKAQFKRDMKQAAHGVAEAAKSVGRSVRDGSKEAWQGTKHAARKVGTGAKEAGTEVGEGAKEAGHKVKAAVKGDGGGEKGE